ncbi:TetR/AcrR family transcriptional regulator [Streptomyces lonarensis]|uniref:TetR family transcriptional regulator n=1 Tax=Streptomyces lonarensis TaxID=700599 RepID=A0A7X6HXP2_9ACTN|nr:TetR/AcrR family transcriptional regulator [Streptomyces lonarensis]NJQ04781.1 TetR family transcriptional regulator [Streptomyces lonarensis]
MPGQPTGLRELTRRTVRSRITEVAEEMFATEGFEATTVEAIAERVGMSKRSFFRYFASKEDVVLHRYEQLGERFAERLLARPAGEDDWEALRRTFDLVVTEFEDPGDRARGAALQRIVQDSPTLLAAYLEQMERLQQRLTVGVRHRRSGECVPPGPEEMLLCALVGSALCCLQTAISHAVRGSDPADVGTRLDTVMAALRPGSLPAALLPPPAQAGDAAPAEAGAAGDDAPAAGERVPCDCLS